MRKVGKQENKKLRDFQMGVLVGILSKAQSDEETEAVLHTILTSSEKAAIAQRAAILLELEKENKYYEIEGKFGVSSSTVTKTMDIYMKNGQYNEVFHNVLDRFDAPEYKPEFIDDNPATELTSLPGGGVRQLIRDQERRNKN